MRFIKFYRWLVPAVTFTIALILLRMVWTKTLVFFFIPWNIFLAILPLYFSYKAAKTSNKAGIFLYAALWLLFFPNAIYIVTDLFHLHERKLAPLWYDLLILISAAINGVTLGFLSLYNMEELLRKKIGKRYLPVITFSIFLLCGYGIYLGRYLRWNSWDIVVQPFSLLSDIAFELRHPFRNAHIWALSISYGIWLYLFYTYVRKAPSLFKGVIN
ncbi:MAG: DUF1361 domain-containing protein [Flavipsychrobacter sp.]